MDALLSWIQVLVVFAGLVALVRLAVTKIPTPARSTEEAPEIAATATPATVATTTPTAPVDTRPADRDDDLRFAVDEIGAEIGLAPSATANLGEHIIVPADRVDTPDGVDPEPGEVHYLPRWHDATWYGDDGFDTGRDAQPARAGETLAYLFHGPEAPPEHLQLVFLVELRDNRTMFVPVANQWLDDQARLCQVTDTA